MSGSTVSSDDERLSSVETALAGEGRGAQQQAQGPYETACFDAAELKRNFGIDPGQHCWVEIASDRQKHLYDLTVQHVGKHCRVSGSNGTGSFTPTIKSWDEDIDEDSARRIALPYPGGRFPGTDAAQSKQKRSKVVTLVPMTHWCRAGPVGG